MAKVLGRGLSLPLRVVLRSPLGHLLHQIHHHARIACHQLFKRFGPDAQKFGVAQRHELGGMFLAAHDQGHFPHRLAGGRQRHHAALALRVRHKDAQASGHHQEQGCVILAVAVQQGAARQAEPVGFAQQVAHRRVAKILQQRKAFQPFAQFFGIDRLLADAEGGQESHVHVLYLPHGRTENVRTLPLLTALFLADAPVTTPSIHHLPSKLNR